MTDCTNADVREKLPEFHGDRLAAAERERVERHLAGCAECTAELSLVRAAARALGSAPAVDVARIVAALPAPPRRAAPGVTPIESRRPARRPLARSGWSSPRRVAAIAATIVGAVGLAIAGSGRARQTGKGAPVVTTPTAAVSPVGAVAPATGSPGGGVQLARASDELSLAPGLSELSDESVRALLGDVENLDDSPMTEPAEALPAISRLDEESGV